MGSIPLLILIGIVLLVMMLWVAWQLFKLVIVLPLIIILLMLVGRSLPLGEIIPELLEPFI